MTRTAGRDEPPEAPRVIELAPMHQLVQENILPDIRRYLNQPPIEGDRTARRAGAPARALIPHRYSGDQDPMPSGQRQQFRWQRTTGCRHQPRLDDDPQVARRHSDASDQCIAAEMSGPVPDRISSMPAERQPLSPIIAEWTAEADRMSSTEFYRAFNRLQRMREAAVRIIDGCDFLIMPSVPRVAFAADQSGFGPDSLFAPWANTFLFNLSEQPASSIPCGISGRGYAHRASDPRQAVRRFQRLPTFA